MRGLGFRALGYRTSMGLVMFLGAYGGFQASRRGALKGFAGLFGAFWALGGSECEDGLNLRAGLKHSLSRNPKRNVGRWVSLQPWEQGGRTLNPKPVATAVAGRPASVLPGVTRTTNLGALGFRV